MASSVAQTVFVMNRLATRSMFAVTRRPSATTPGIVENLPSSSTSCATARVAGAPDPIATPMSASFNASASLTPSPVMATVCPRACSAFTMSCFWCGVTRPNTECCSSVSPSSSRSSGSSRASNGRSAFGMPTRAATAPTVWGLSPEMTFNATPCCAKYARVSAASGRTCSSSSTRAAGCISGGRLSPSSGASVCGEEQHPLTRAGEGFGLLRDFAVAPGPHQLGRTEHPRAVLAERRRAPLACRRERDEPGASPGVRRRERRRDRVQRRVAVLVGRERRERGLDRRLIVEPFDAVEHDVPVGERAGLVEADHVDPGQPLDRGQLLDEHLATSQRDRGDPEGDARQQHETLGNHARRCRRRCR